MKRILTMLPALLLVLSGCVRQPPAYIPPETVPASTAAGDAQTSSTLQVEGVSWQDAFTYFEEVCLSAEISYEGDATVVQKWVAPIYYRIYGDCTDADMQVLTGFADWLNGLEGFPGIYPAAGLQSANLDIYFCDEAGLLEQMGEEYAGTDGAVRFWYDGENRLYDAIICYRTDIDQTVRNSVILEEIYNCIGPMQDTRLREDSICYQGFSTPQALTEIDALILKLLYHPDMQCGMTAAECKKVIREIYR